MSASKLVLFSVHEGSILVLNCLRKATNALFQNTNRISFAVSLDALLLYSSFHQARRDDLG